MPVKDFLPSLEASIGRLRECLVKTESQAREMERHEMERRREEGDLHFARGYIDKRLADNEQGIEQPVELPSRMTERSALEELVGKRLPPVPKKPTG